MVVFHGLFQREPFLAIEKKATLFEYWKSLTRILQYDLFEIFDVCFKFPQ